MTKHFAIGLLVACHAIPGFAQVQGAPFWGGPVGLKKAA